MTEKPIVHWCVPRSVSTAFERIFMHRDDVKAMHEPFSVAYYYGPDRKDRRYGDVPVEEDESYARVKQRILTGPEGKRVFVKDMACYFDPADTAFLSRVHNTFLIRHPSAAMASYYKKWQDFSLQETGYPGLKTMFYAVADLTGEIPLLFDANRLCADPVTHMAHYCAHVGVTFDERYLSWKPGRVKQFAPWKGWHDEAQNSDGIKPLSDPPDMDELEPYAREMARDVMPIYEELLEYVWTPEG